MSSVTIVGPGRVGVGLALTLSGLGYSIDRLIARDATLFPGDLTWPVVSLADSYEIDSDIIFVTTRDQEIAETAIQVAERCTGSGFAFHTSGSYPSTILEPFAEAGRSIGSIHPLVSISRSIDAHRRFTGAYFCVEGESTAVELGTRIVTDLGGIAFSISTEKKTLYHAAAVMACGHLVALLDASLEAMELCGMDRRLSRTVLMPLIRSTIENFAEQDAPDALTGTFARADLDTFSRHIAALNETVDEDLIEIYLLLGERSLELAEQSGVSADRVEKMRAKVAIAKSRLRD